MNAYRRMAARHGLAAFSVAAALWGSKAGMAQIPKPSSPADPAIKVPPVSLTLTTDKKTYAVGDPIKITMTVKNATKQAIPLRFSSGQRYDLTLTSGTKPEDSKIEWQWSRGRMFTQMVSSQSLEPGKTLTFTETLDPKGTTAAPPKPLAAGKYTLTGILTTMSGPRASTTTILTVK